MTTSKATADVTTAVIGTGFLCGAIAPLFGVIVWSVVGRLMGHEQTLAPGVTPAPWIMALPMFSVHALVVGGPPAAVLGAAGAALVIGLRRLRVVPVAAALLSASIGVFAGLLVIALPSTLSSLRYHEPLTAVTSAWLNLRQPHTMAAALTGMAFGVGIWFMLGRERRG
jgi:hypothetical protein